MDQLTFSYHDVTVLQYVGYAAAGYGLLSVGQKTIELRVGVCVRVPTTSVYMHVAHDFVSSFLGDCVGVA